MSGPRRDKNGNLQNITKWPQCTLQRSAPESQLAYCQRAVCVPIELPTIGRAPLPYSQTPNSQCLNHSTIRLETSNLPEGKIEGS